MVALEQRMSLLSYKEGTPADIRANDTEALARGRAEAAAVAAHLQDVQSMM